MKGIASAELGIQRLEPLQGGEAIPYHRRWNADRACDDQFLNAVIGTTNTPSSL